MSSKELADGRSCSYPMDEKGTPCGHVTVRLDESAYEHCDLPPELKERLVPRASHAMCLVHAHGHKDVEAFRAEIDRMLAAPGRHSFRGFVFPAVAHFSNVKFAEECDFREAVFTEAAVLRGAEFAHGVTFDGASFIKDADFSGAKLNECARFQSAIFGGDSKFRVAKLGATSFWLARFIRYADFGGTEFAAGETRFDDARFPEGAFFGAAKFKEGGRFRRVEFGRYACFKGTVFGGDADFSEATFAGDGDFVAAEFAKGATFVQVTFGPSDPTPQTWLSSIADFSDARFLTPEAVRFERVNESPAAQPLHVRFRGCGVEAVRFLDVNWYSENGRFVLLDELDLESPWGNRKHELVAAVYRQLAKNFEASRAYELAEQADIGAMEMRRRDPRSVPFGRTFWMEKMYRKHPWLSDKVFSRLSITSLYDNLSRYGTNYWRAFRILVLALVFFGFAYALPAVRLALPGAPPAATSETAGDATARIRAGLRHSLEIGTLRGDRTTRKTGSALGLLLEIAETIAIPSQAALLLFSLQRRLRR